MATADASGPFQWPLIDGMVAVNAGDVAVESKRCVNHGSFHFLWFPEGRVSYPDSRVERGAERHNALTENHWRRSSGNVGGSGLMKIAVARRHLHGQASCNASMTRVAPASCRWAGFCCRYLTTTSRAWPANTAGIQNTAAVLILCITPMLRPYPRRSRGKSRAWKGQKLCNRHRGRFRLKTRGQFRPPPRCCT